ncbi:MAG: phosphoenolpyruvate--protein phosphotransferase [Planctomycetota bacterium]
MSGSRIEGGGQITVRTVRGIGVSEGMSIGTAHVLRSGRRRVARREIKADQTAAELARLDGAVEGAVAELMQVHGRATAEMGEEAAKIFLFHIGMLKDNSVMAPVRERIERDHERAEWAIERSFEALATRFRKMGDTAFSTKVNDIRDLENRLLDQLEGEEPTEPAALTQPDSIVISDELTPSQTAGLDRQAVVGFATDFGGGTSHTSIVARALGLPAVVGCRSISTQVETGETLILDGDRGLVIIDPDEDTLELYRARIETARTVRQSLQELAAEDAVTLDGERIALLGNIEFPDEVEGVLGAGGDGVGLYRTEFLYLTSTVEPTEDDHYKAYRRCLDLLGPDRELVIRTVDLGADKYTQARVEIPERNPALGNRSIRYCLRSLPMFKRQLRAILRASAHGNIKIMFPLVTTLGELRHARMILRDVMEEMAENSEAFDAAVPVGMMVETPASAVSADAFAKEVDFFSIGTNDLTQYVLAVDRTNERVADLYEPANPAILKLIRDVTRSARRREIDLSICGEAAGQPEYAMLLIGMGVRRLSATAGRIPRLKRLIRALRIADCERVARKAISFDSAADVSAYLRDRARKLVPEAFDGRAVGESS